MRRNLLAALALWALAAPATGAVYSTATPERVEPMRKKDLSPERYRQLRDEWKVYAEAHPNDPRGWAQLAKAAGYAGEPCTSAVGYAARAVRIGPDNAEALAVLGGWKWAAWCDGQPVDAGEAIGLLERALVLDPDLDDAHLRLWVMRLSKGQLEAAAGDLRSLLDRNRIPEPLVDYGYNELVGLDPDAILLTNGDNDTYPAVALQAARGFRSDVAVINLSMLNMGWYRHMLRDGRFSVPVPLLDQSASSLGGSDEAVRGMFKALADAGGKRSLYAACTVDLQHHSIPGRLSLEGLVYRVLPATGSGTEADTARLARNLATVYRLESATSPALDWEAWSSVRTLMLNYVAPELQLAAARGKANDREGVRESLTRALTLCEFHHIEYTQQVLDMWAQVDSKSRDLARWTERLKK